MTNTTPDAKRRRDTSEAVAAFQVNSARRRVKRHMEDLQTMPAAVFRDPETAAALTGTVKMIMSTLGGTVTIKFDGQPR